MLYMTSLFSVVLSALVVIAAPALELKVAGPSEVTDINNLKVVTTVTNTGDEAIKLLNHPSGVLDNFYPTDTFAIQHGTTGLSPKFVGVQVTYLVDMAIQDNKDSSFTVLKPGESAKVTHDLSSRYDFSETGEGKYSFQPSNSFIYVDPATSEAAIIYARSSDLQLSISGSLTPASTNVGLNPDAGNCTAAQQQGLRTTATTTNNLVRTTYDYTRALTRATPRWTTWFGPFTSSSFQVVVNVFYRLAGGGGPANNFLNYTYYCETGCKQYVVAFVYPNRYAEVFLCPYYFTFPESYRPGFLTHEATHFTAIGGTKDWAYGVQPCKDLARNNPAQAINNADNYRYYTENTA